MARSSSKKRKPSRGKKQRSDTGPDPLEKFLNLRALPVLALAALTVFFFRNLLFPVGNPSAWLWEDFLYQNYPYRFFAATSLARGFFPFWNPYVFAGQPFFADVQTAVLYPFNLLEALFASPDHLSSYLIQLVELLHYWLAGWFTCRFLRATGLDEGPSLVGAVAFSFSGFLVTHALHMNFVYVFIWLPLVLEFVEKALAGGRWRYAFYAALALAVSTLGGYPQYSMFIFYTTGLYWLVFELTRAEGEQKSPRARAARLGMLVFIAAGALSLNAVTYLPASELAKYTPRKEMTFAASSENSMPLYLLLKLLSPFYFGAQTPGEMTYWAGGYAHFWETCLYVGLLPLILAMVSLAELRRRNPHVIFAAVLALLAIWLALGKYGLLYRVFFEFAPGFGRFRIPGRLSCLASFALAVLAAHGWAYLAREAGSIKENFRRSALFVSLAVTAALLIVMFYLPGSGMGRMLADGALARPEVRETALSAATGALGWFVLATAVLLAAVWLDKWRRQISYAAALLVTVELSVLGTAFLEGDMSPEQCYQYSQTVRRFQELSERELFRINSRSLENPGIMLLRRNQGAIHRISLLEGYMPLHLSRKLGHVQKDRQFDLLNVRYMIRVDMEKQTAGFVERESYLPRAFMVHRWRVMDQDERILDTLNSEEFDYRSEAVLERDPGIAQNPGDTHIESGAGIVRYTQNEIVIEVDAAAPGILVLGEWDYPGWKVWVDSEPAEVLRTDYALRGVALGQGSHTVRFAYSSATFRRGAAVSLASLIVLAALFIFVRRREKRADRQ